MFWMHGFIICLCEVLKDFKIIWKLAKGLKCLNLEKSLKFEKDLKRLKKKKQKKEKNSPNPLPFSPFQPGRPTGPGSNPAAGPSSPPLSLLATDRWGPPVGSVPLPPAGFPCFACGCADHHLLWRRPCPRFLPLLFCAIVRRAFTRAAPPSSPSPNSRNRRPTKQ
jgi:hypothetical protein